MLILYKKSRNQFRIPPYIVDNILYRKKIILGISLQEITPNNTLIFRKKTANLRARLLYQSSFSNLNALSFLSNFSANDNRRVLILLSFFYIKPMRTWKMIEISVTKLLVYNWLIGLSDRFSISDRFCSWNWKNTVTHSAFR